MAYTINTKYGMKSKLQSIQNGKVTKHRGFVDAEKWIGSKIDFLTKIYKFDTFDVDRTGDVFTVRCHRDANKPGTSGKSMDITFVLTLVD